MCLFVCLFVLDVCTGVFLHVYLCILSIQCPRRPEVGVVRSLGVELKGGYWELSLDPSEEQPLFLTAELFFYPCFCIDDK